MENQLTHIHILKSCFQEKKARNDRYSLRAYANFLGMDASSLSKVMKGQRDLPSSLGAQIVGRLNLEENQKNLFYKSLVENRRKRVRDDGSDWSYKELQSEKAFKVIADWEYFAILNLVKLKSFQPQPEWISERLGIELCRVKEVLIDLLELKLLEEGPSGELFRTAENLSTATETPNPALVKAHRQELELASSSLENDSIEERGFYSLSVPGSPEAFMKLKKLCFDFLGRCSKLMEKSEAEEVYQMNIQCFSLSNSKRKDVL